MGLFESVEIISILLLTNLTPFLSGVLNALEYNLYDCIYTVTDA